MNNSQQRRLWIVLIGLGFATAVIIGRLFAFQIVQGKEFAGKHIINQVLVEARPERGIITDRHGVVLAANRADYRISASPNLVTNPAELATALAPILQESRIDLLAKLTDKQPYVVLSKRVSAEVAASVRALPYKGLAFEPLPRRLYPQGEMLCHTLGYVDFDGNGGGGLEGYYQTDLAGMAASARVNISPLEVQQSVIAREGADLRLTIDAAVQHTVEQHLRDALAEHVAVSGEIIVMDPRTGAIRAMASLPCYNPDQFYDVQDKLLFLNPIVTKQFEPGSVMKLITMAAALDSGTVTPQTTYYDSGVLEVGGHRTVNWDRGAHGTVDMVTLLSRSLNVGAATIATWTGTETYYDYMQRFGFGRPTGIDLLAEAGGLMPLPGSANWTESFIATNSYGQSVAVTPLQMITAVSALANGGRLMQPYVVEEIRRDSNVFVHAPQALSQPIKPETAHQMTAMAITAVVQEVPQAQIPGYTVAGKTGTAQIAENGIYNPTDVIGTFIGWLPADAPEVIVFVKLDRPTSAPWGSQTAAPVFARLARELVVLLDIPPDGVRLQGDILAVRGQ